MHVHTHIDMYVSLHFQILLVIDVCLFTANYLYIFIANEYQKPDDIRVASSLEHRGNTREILTGKLLVY